MTNAGKCNYTSYHDDDVENTHDKNIGYQYYEENRQKNIASKICFICGIFAIVILILGLSTAIAISNNHEITDNVTQVDVPYETETIVKGTVKTNDPVNYSFSPKYNSTVNASIPNKKKLSMCIEGSILDLTAFAQVNMLPIITEDSSAEYTDANLWTSVEIKNCKVEKVEITLCSY